MPSRPRAHPRSSFRVSPPTSQPLRARATDGITVPINRSPPRVVPTVALASADAITMWLMIQLSSRMFPNEHGPPGRTGKGRIGKKVAAHRMAVPHKRRTVTATESQSVSNGLIERRHRRFLLARCQPGHQRLPHLTATSSIPIQEATGMRWSMDRIGPSYHELIGCLSLQSEHLAAALSHPRRNSTHLSRQIVQHHPAEASH